MLPPPLCHPVLREEVVIRGGGLEGEIIPPVILHPPIFISLFRGIDSSSHLSLHATACGERMEGALVVLPLRFLLPILLAAFHNRG